MTQIVEALVDGGKATAGPPLGPALGPLGVNIPQIVKEINVKTKDFEGMKVPVKITIDEITKSFEITVGKPPTSALILKEVNLEKGSGKCKENFVGNLSMEQIMKIAKIKNEQLLGKNIKNKIREVIGTCVSLGITVDGKPSRQVIKEINEGKYDKFFSK